MIPPRDDVQNHKIAQKYSFIHSFICVHLFIINEKICLLIYYYYLFIYCCLFVYISVYAFICLLIIWSIIMPVLLLTFSKTPFNSSLSYRPVYMTYIKPDWQPKKKEKLLINWEYSLVNVQNTCMSHTFPLHYISQRYFLVPPTPYVILTICWLTLLSGYNHLARQYWFLRALSSRCSCEAGLREAICIDISKFVWRCTCTVK